MSQISIDNAMTPQEFVDALNNNFEYLFAPQYIYLTYSGATQAIPTEEWTTVLFDTVTIKKGPSYLENNAGNFAADDTPTASGLWNGVWTVCWDNTQVGLPRHVRKIRNVQDGNDNPLAVGFPLGTQDMVFDPAAGVTGEAAKSFQQCYMQPGLSNAALAISYMTLEVWQNSGYTINLIKDGIQAPVMQLVKAEDQD